MQPAAVDSVSGGAAYFACSYAADLAVLIEGNLAVNYGIAILHVNRCALTVNHTCSSCCTIQCQFSITIGNSVAGYVDICQFCTFISIYAIFGCNVASSFDSTVGTADAYIFASQIAKHDILVHVNLVELLTVNISFFNIDVVAAYYLAVFACFGCYCMQLAAVYSIGGISGYCACCYTGNLAVCSNSYFAQLSAFSGDLAVVAVCIAYIQLTVTQCGIFIEHAIFQNYVADFAFGCGYFAVFIYNQFAVGSIECTVAVYEERYSAVFICSTYGQIVFCVQCIGLNGVYTGNVAFFIDSYLTKLSGFRSDLAVVAVCIAYIQLTVTQCGIFIEHAIFQNYVADFAFGCGYFAVFIYNQFAVGSIECTVAVYEERYSAVFICSTYGQVVFCVQCVGLNGVYINIFIQLNLNIGTIIADFNVLVAAEINNFAGSYIGCFGCNTVGGKIPAFICICSYLFDFFQLAYIYSISIINAFSYVSDYFIVSIQAIFGDVSIAAKTNAHIIIHEEFTSMNAVNIKVSAKFNLNGRAKKFLCCTYDDISFVTVKVNITARLYFSSCCYTIINRQIPTFVSVI